MGLDHYIYRRYCPPKPKDINGKILVELEDEEKEESEEIFEWRKDYKLHEFIFENIGSFVNCEELPLTKEHLIKILEYFVENNGTKANGIYDWKLDYSKEITQLNDILEYEHFEEYEYFYYAWW